MELPRSPPPSSAPSRFPGRPARRSVKGPRQDAASSRSLESPLRAEWLARWILSDTTVRSRVRFPQRANK